MLSYITPTISTTFILHIILSVGRFLTEVGLLLHGIIRESPRYFSLIGPENENESLETYTNHLIQSFIDEQVQYFPNK